MGGGEGVTWTKILRHKTSRSVFSLLELTVVNMDFLVKLHFVQILPKYPIIIACKGNVMSQDGLTVMATTGDQNRFKPDADILFLLLFSGKRVRYGISSRSSCLLLEDGETSPVPLTKPQSKSAAAHVADLRGATSSL